MMLGTPTVSVTSLQKPSTLPSEDCTPFSHGTAEEAATV